jgi:hypothetical protein
MKKLESSEVYRVLVEGRVVFSGNEDEALDMITDLSIQYYETGSPNPSTITLERIPDNGEIESIPDWEKNY